MNKLIQRLEWPAAALLLLPGFSAHAQDAATKAQTNAPVANVEVSARETAPDVPKADQAKPAAPSYWIGILGGEVSDALRAHLGLEGAGVLVREVVPNSPAAEGGLKQHDVLLTANGQPVTEMATLAKIVSDTGGEQDGKIVIDLLRTGAHQQVTVTPAARPATPQNMGAAPAFAGQPIPADQFEGLGEQFGQAFGDGQPFRFRLFGPGMAFGGANVDVQAPGNTSVQVNTVDGKTRVTVMVNGEKFEVDANDPESLEQIPEGMRPMVEGLLNGQATDIDINIPDVMPQIEGLLEGLGERFEGRREERREDRLRRRLETLQRQMEALRAELGAAPAARAAETPAVNPPAPAVELEIPVEEGAN